MTGPPDTSENVATRSNPPDHRRLLKSSHDCCGVASQLEDDLFTRNACGQVETNDVRTRETHDWQARIINESERQFDATGRTLTAPAGKSSLGKDFAENGADSGVRGDGLNDDGRAHSDRRRNLIARDELSGKLNGAIRAQAHREATNDRLVRSSCIRIQRFRTSPRSGVLLRPPTERRLRPRDLGSRQIAGLPFSAVIGSATSIIASVGQPRDQGSGPFGSR